MIKKKLMHLLTMSAALSLLLTASSCDESKSWTPDTLLFIGHPDVRNANFGIWRGAPRLYKQQDAYNPYLPTLVVPDPSVRRIAVIVFDESGLDLPPTLEEGKVYIWRGDEDFVFWKAFEKQPITTVAERNALAKQLGIVEPLLSEMNEDPGFIPFGRKKM